MSARVQRFLVFYSLATITVAACCTTALGQGVPKSNDKAAIKPATITNDTFTNSGGTGFWNNAANWSSGLPAAANNVLITGTGSAASVTEDISATINNLTLNSANTWTLNNTEALTISGNAISNAGKMTMNSTGNVTELIIGGSAVTLSGGGTLTLSNNANNYIFGSAAADTLTNQETIQGAGHIGDNQMTLVNSGVINANQSAGMTIGANGGLSNTGTLEATAGSTLAISGTTVGNMGGTISANTGILQVTNSNIYGGTLTLTGASTLQLSNGTIQFGSTLNNSSTGTIEAVGFTANTLGGTVNNPAGGLLKIDNGAVLNLANGAYPTLGTVQLNSSGNNTELVVNGGVTLSGGSVALSNNVANYIFGAASGDTLTNQETIQGAGHIGNAQMTLVNSGTINANQSAGMTIAANGGATNTGTIEATAGATLLLSGTTVANTGGTISANAGKLQLTNSIVNGGTVTLTGASSLLLGNGIIHGGSTLTNSSTGTIEALASTTNTLGGTVNNPAGGVLKLDNATVLNLENGSYPTLGTVQLNSTGNNTELVLNGGVTLSGGSVTLSNNAANYIFGAAPGDTLTNQETIQGAGHIGNSQMTLVNSGTINANQSAGMTIAPNGGTTNTGTIEANGGATLALSGTTVTNTGGTISANASRLQVTNSTINGGTVTLTGASSLQLGNGTIHGGSTLTNSATGTLEAVASTNNTLGGTINNPSGGLLKIDNAAVLNLESGTYPTLGAVQLNSTGNNTELVVKGNVTLSGGSMTLSNNASNYIFGASSGDVLTNQETIQGAGHIGNAQMTLVNSGTLNANQSAGMTIAANGGATNTGTIEANAGATLALNGTTLTNTGATVSASGSTLQVTNSTITGGTVTLTGASSLQLINGTIHGGSALNGSSTGTIEAVASTNNTLGGTLNNPSGGLLKIDNAAVLHLENGSYSTLGAVQLNSTGNNTELILNGGVTLSGGSVTLSNNPANYIFGEASGDTLTNTETIQGAGHIGNGEMTLVTSGIINANQSGGMTIASNGGATNTGTIEANGGATLALSGTTVANTGGTISASGGILQVTNSTINGGAITLTGASSLQLTSGTIHGGSTLTNSSTGTIEAVASTNNTLGGTVNNPAGGLLKIDNGAVLNLENGTYAALGTVQLNSTGNNTELVVKGGVTLSGGSVTLSNNPANYIFGAASGDTLTNLETIQGAGNIGDGQMTLVNSGAINANQTNPLLVQTNAFTNNGTLQVGSGDVLHVKGGIFTNFFGTTLSGGTYNSSGTLEIDNLGSAGGEIVTNAANIVLNGDSSSFVDAGAKNALSNLAVNAPGSGFTITGGRNFTTAGNFTNNGALTVGSGSNFTVTGSLTNFSGTTLTGGVYNIAGTMQFVGANIVTNAANISLIGTSSQILNSTSANGLANLAANASAGVFSLQGGRTLTTTGSFSNAGVVLIGSGSAFTVGGTGTFTQTAGTTTDDGTLTLPSAGKLNLTSGALFGQGVITGAVASSGTVTPGDSPTATGILKDTGAYTQNAAGVLNVAISGTTAGTGYDQLNPTTATLGGTLNINRPTGFVPTIGTTFKIMNFTSETGTFATVNGLAINSSEHFTVTYQSTDVLLTVVSGADFKTPVPSIRGTRLKPSAILAYGPSTPVNAIASVGPRGPDTSRASYGVSSQTSAPLRRLAPGGRQIPHKFLEYDLNLLSLLPGNRGKALRGMWRQPGDPSASGLGSLSFSGYR